VALSDQLTELAARAKDVEDRAAAAQSKAKADLEQDVADARASAQAQAKKLRESAEERKGEALGLVA
jgi:predicted  nucleic acid-binding Zn-ribbon protein